MARKLRIEYAGAICHVMARGNQGVSDFPRQPGPELGAVEGQAEPVGIHTTMSAKIIGPTSSRIMGLLDDLFELLFPRKQYGTRSTTRLGVEVRSRAEQKIADYFDSVGLRYEYERELESGFLIFTEKVSSPDFYLPDFDVYVEYWGMLGVDNDYDRSKYTREMKYKMARYHDLGVKFISIYPDNLKNLDWVFRKRFKEVTGQSLPSRRQLGEEPEISSEQDTEQFGRSIPETIFCPQCGQPMILRTSKRGANAGSQFWGCSTYPACRGTRRLSSPNT